MERSTCRRCLSRSTARSPGRSSCGLLPHQSDQTMLKRIAILSAVCVLLLALLPSSAADTLPSRNSDAEFWRIVTDFSEAGGAFPYENFVSNEVSYQDIIPDLTRLAKTGGAYIGVAPEQNFTYIAAIKPKVSFILDIRRQNLIELLM